MSKLKNILQGRRNKRSGDFFENQLHKCSLRDGWNVIKIPMGARMLGHNKMVRVRTAFDFVMTKPNNQAVFLDMKTVQSKTFSSSKITEHQVEALMKLHNQGYKAGYVVNYSELNTTVFYTAKQLYLLHKGTSLKPQDGIALGDNLNIRLDMIFVNAPPLELI